MKSIQIYLKGNSWTAAFLVNGSPDNEITSLFGTHHLPTSYTAQASADIVLHAIQKLNPDSVVTIS